MTVSASIIGDVVPYAELVELCNALGSIRDNCGPADRETVQKAMDWLNFQRGAIGGLESRLNGDMAAVPEKALSGVVVQHVGDEPNAFNTGMALARDVRLLCFFQALERAGEP